MYTCRYMQYYFENILYSCLREKFDLKLRAIHCNASHLYSSFLHNNGVSLAVVSLDKQVPFTRHAVLYCLTMYLWKDPRPSGLLRAFWFYFKM